jgi:hypothetical protein
MKYLQWGVIFLTGITMVACLQVAQPTPRSGLAPTMTVVPPTPISCQCTPVVVTEVVTPISMAETTPCVPCNEVAYERISEDCSPEECLFKTEYALEGNYPVGIATIAGYYTQVERFGYGDDKETCDSFVIIGGSQGVIESVLALVDSGNSVYSKNESNQPVINLDLSILDEVETRQILGSTIDEPVELIVLADVPGHREAPICFTRFETLKVKNTIRP